MCDKNKPANSPEKKSEGEFIEIANENFSRKEANGGQNRIRSERPWPPRPTEKED
jgi:hypothetical protein